MRFAEPIFLWGLALLPLFALLFWFSYHRRKKLSERFVSSTILPKVATSLSSWRRLVKSSLLLVAIAFLCIALARPQWGAVVEHVERKGLDILLLQDVSLSMLADDVKPNRLVRSKHEIAAFVDSLNGDRVGLVYFSGEAKQVVPFTLDYGVVHSTLAELTPEMILPGSNWLMPGTNMERAINTGLQAFSDTTQKAKYSIMILMSDGEELDASAVAAAKTAAQKGVKIYTIGIGSLEGVPIPLPSKNGATQYKRDSKGEIVTTRLEERTLMAIAEATGGKYYHVSPNEFQLQKVLTEIANLEKKEFSSDFVNSYKDRYQIFLAVSALLFLLEALISEKGRKRKLLNGRFS